MRSLIYSKTPSRLKQRRFFQMMKDEKSLVSGEARSNLLFPPKIFCSEDAPSACTILATQQLMRIAENSSNDEEIKIVNVKTDLGINNMEKVEEIIKIKSIESSIKDQIFSCVQHPMFNKQVSSSQSIFNFSLDLLRLKKL